MFLPRAEQLKQINVCGRDLRAAAATRMEIWDVVGRNVARQHPVIPRPSLSLPACLLLSTAASFTNGEMWGRSCSSCAGETLREDGKLEASAASGRAY